MEKIESIYELILRTKFEFLMVEVLRDIKIIEFAIISMNIDYKTNIYNKMLDKYTYDLEKIGFSKAIEINSNYYSYSNLSEESRIRNNLSILRRWIIRCSGYMCVRKVAEENVPEGLDSYMKRYSIGEDVSDIYTLQDKLNSIDEDILSCLQNSI